MLEIPTSSKIWGRGSVATEANILEIRLKLKDEFYAVSPHPPVYILSTEHGMDIWHVPDIMIWFLLPIVAVFINGACEVGGFIDEAAVILWFSDSLSRWEDERYDPSFV